MSNGAMSAEVTWQIVPVISDGQNSVGLGQSQSLGGASLCACTPPILRPITNTPDQLRMISEPNHPVSSADKHTPDLTFVQQSGGVPWSIFTPVSNLDPCI